jgi:hypothetical protein
MRVMNVDSRWLDEDAVRIMISRDESEILSCSHRVEV